MKFKVGDEVIGRKSGTSKVIQAVNRGSLTYDWLCKTSGVVHNGLDSKSVESNFYLANVAVPKQNSPKLGVNLTDGFEKGQLDGMTWVKPVGQPGCECGAVHTSFPNFHLQYCKLHKPH